MPLSITATRAPCAVDPPHAQDGDRSSSEIADGSRMTADSRLHAGRGGSLEPSAMGEEGADHGGDGGVARRVGGRQLAQLAGQLVRGRDSHAAAVDLGQRGAGDAAEKSDQLDVVDRERPTDLLVDHLERPQDAVVGAARDAQHAGGPDAEGDGGADGRPTSAAPTEGNRAATAAMSWSSSTRMARSSVPSRTEPVSWPRRADSPKASPGPSSADAISSPSRAGVSTRARPRLTRTRRPAPSRRPWPAWSLPACRRPATSASSSGASSAKSGSRARADAASKGGWVGIAPPVCSAQRLAYTPPSSTSSSWVPCSTTRPSATTKRRSECTIDASRWVT